MHLLNISQPEYRKTQAHRKFMKLFNKNQPMKSHQIKPP